MNRFWRNEVADQRSPKLHDMFCPHIRNCLLPTAFPMKWNSGLWPSPSWSRHRRKSWPCWVWWFSFSQPLECSFGVEHCIRHIQHWKVGGVCFFFCYPHHSVFSIVFLGRCWWKSFGMFFWKENRPLFFAAWKTFNTPEALSMKRKTCLCWTSTTSWCLLVFGSSFSYVNIRMSFLRPWQPRRHYLEVGSSFCSFTSLELASKQNFAKASVGCQCLLVLVD